MPGALAAAHGGVPLIVDAGGEVLEAAWANVAVRSGATLRTPPADGRILSGTARARRLREGAAAEARVTHAVVAAADEVLLASALRRLRARS